MTDFKSIIDEAKKRSDASAAEQASALVQEQERKRAQVDAGIGWLETTAIPKLEEALTAFREKGVGFDDYAELRRRQDR